MRLLVSFWVGIFIFVNGFSQSFYNPRPVLYELTCGQEQPEVGKPFVLNWKITATDPIDISQGILYVYRLSFWGTNFYWKSVPTAFVLTANDYAFESDFIRTVPSGNKKQGTFSITLNEEGNYYFVLMPERGAVAFSTKAIHIVTQGFTDKRSHTNANGMFTWKCNLVDNVVRTTLLWTGTTKGEYSFYYMQPIIIRKSRHREPYPYKSSEIVGSFGGRRKLSPLETQVLGQMHILDLSDIKSIIPMVPVDTFEGDLCVLPIVQKEQK